jgi:hypothetical protein
LDMASGTLLLRAFFSTVAPSQNFLTAHGLAHK